MMIKISTEKIYNSYLIESYDYNNVKKSIKEFAILVGFDKNLVEANTHPDIVYLEYDDKIIPVSDIRNLVIDTVNYTPKVADRKLYIIYDAKNLSDITQNALLKTLEEPPTFVTFFLVTSNLNKLFDTVKSRCQILKDTVEIDYKQLLSLEYIDDALVELSNIKYSPIYLKNDFIEKVLYTENDLSNIIRLYRLALKDALLYKTTLSKNKIEMREKEEVIISIANSLTFDELGKLIDKIDRLSLINSYNVNKKLALFSFLQL